MTYSQADAMMSAGYVVKGFFERVDNRMLGKIAHELGACIFHALACEGKTLED